MHDAAYDHISDPMITLAPFHVGLPERAPSIERRPLERPVRNECPAGRAERRDRQRHDDEREAGGDSDSSKDVTPLERRPVRDDRQKRSVARSIIWRGLNVARPLVP